MYSSLLRKGSNNIAKCRFYLHGAKPISKRELDNFVSEFVKILIGYKSQSELLIQHYDMIDTLRKHMVGEYFYENKYYDELLLNIIGEQRIFLQNQSWIVSRLKKPFNRIINAGALCMHFGEKTVEKMVRRTLKKDDNYLLERVDRYRAFGKWGAV